MLVRRASAISLLLAFAYAVLAPALFADPESVLPECCRRNGDHHCSMNAPSPAPSDGPTFQLIQRCAAFPLAPAVQGAGAAVHVTISSAIFAGILSHPATQYQTEARARVSFSRSRQKRGPPSLLS